MKGKLGLIIGLGIVLFLGLLVYSSMNLTTHRVEVCMTFQGRTQCRTASGKTQAEAARTATENACALISSGMTDSIACQNTPPNSTKVLQ